MARILNFLTSPKVFLTSLIPSNTASLTESYCLGLGISGSGVFLKRAIPKPSHQMAVVMNTKLRTHGLHFVDIPKKPVSPTIRCTIRIVDPPKNPYAVPQLET